MLRNPPTNTTKGWVNMLRNNLKQLAPGGQYAPEYSQAAGSWGISMLRNSAMVKGLAQFELKTLAQNEPLDSLADYNRTGTV